MTTTLWIVIAALTAVIGAWVGYVKWVNGCKSPDASKRLLSILNKLDNDNDLFYCMKSCKDRRTPNEDINIHLRKIACKFTDEENARKVEQANIEAAESAKVHHREGTRYVGNLVDDMGYTLEEAGEAEMKALSDSIIITHPNHKPIRIVDGKMEFIEVAGYGIVPDCEGDDCRIVGKTFFGGDGIV